MAGFRALWGFVVAASALLFVVGIMSRLLSVKETPQTIRDGANALTNLFNGAFGA